VCRRIVEVEVVLFHIFAVIALIAGQPEEPLFQDGIALVPQRECKTDELTPITNTRETIFIPTIGT